MHRVLTLALVALLFPATSLFAQKPLKNMDELQQMLSDSGLSCEVRKDGVRVAIPDTKWELYAHLTARGTKVWMCFTCQHVPKNPSAAKLLELLQANHNAASGIYFTVSASTGIIYINHLVDNRGLTPDILREKVNQVADFAQKHTKLWDPSFWNETTEPNIGKDPTTAATKTPFEGINLTGTWKLRIEENQQSVAGTAEFSADGTFILNVTDPASKNKAQVQGNWKFADSQLEMTATKSKQGTKTFRLAASMTGSKTEHQFLATGETNGKLILER